MRIAVIDTGTNSTRLLIADTEPGQVREIMRETTITRLGEGVETTGQLSPAARKRVTQCLAGYAASIGELGVRRTLVIATSSMRDAGNGAPFLESLAEGFGFDHRMLSGNEEARLAFSGATMDMDPGVKAMLFDVGGGSTEVVIGRGRDIEMAVSMSIGCVRLKERFLRSDPSDAAELNEAAAVIDGLLETFVDTNLLTGLEETVAVAGTVTTMAAIDLKLEKYDREQVHGHIMQLSRMRAIREMLGSLTLEERTMLPVIEAGRADVIVAGALIVERLLEHTGVESFTVSERDILDGAALAMGESRL